MAAAGNQGGSWFGWRISGHAVMVLGKARSLGLRSVAYFGQCLMDLATNAGGWLTVASAGCGWMLRWWASASVGWLLVVVVLGGLVKADLGWVCWQLR